MSGTEAVLRFILAGVAALATIAVLTACGWVLYGPPAPADRALLALAWFVITLVWWVSPGAR